MRSGYQDLAAKGLMTFDELGEKLQGLEETRKTAEGELEVLRSRRERIEELERDKELLLKSYASMAPEALDSLLPEERHQVYQMLRLKVVAHVDSTLEVSGAFTGNDLSKSETGYAHLFRLMPGRSPFQCLGDGPRRSLPLRVRATSWSS
jgi:hypothetical protein